MTATRLELTRTVLGVLAIFTLLAASFWILRPFIAATIWSTMVVVSTWPIMLLIQERLGGRRWLAVAIMVLALLLVLFVPFSLAILTIVDNAGLIVDWFNRLAVMEVPPPPDWVGGLPFVGERIAGVWNDVIAGGPGALYAKFGGYINPAARWFASEVGGFGVMTLQFLLTVVISGIMYSTGERAAAGLHAFARRLAGNHGEDVLLLGAQAIRGVALGVVVTALVQSTLGGIGLFIAGVPLAALLTAVMVMTTLAQLGPILVLAPAVAWLFWTGDTVWGVALLIWTLLVGTMDNFLRPWLIKKGADLPLLLIFAGVIGGLLAFGLVGIFVGPVVLAVTYTLLKAWIATSPEEASVEVVVQTAEPESSRPPPPAVPAAASSD